MKQIVSLSLLLSIAYVHTVAQQSPDNANQSSYFVEWSELADMDKYQKGSRNYFISKGHRHFYKGEFEKAIKAYRRVDSLAPVKDTLLLRNYQDAVHRSGEKPENLARRASKNVITLKGSINPVARLNSKQSDFGYFSIPGREYYVSSKPRKGLGKKLKYYFNKQPFLDVYEVKNGASKEDSLIALPAGVETKMHDGPLYVSPDQNWLFVTHNYFYTNKKDKKNLYIDYYRRKKNRWVKKGMLPFCHKSYSVQHPVFWPESKILIFSTNKPGGTGGFDLYSTTFTDSGWSKAQNLGPVINSVYDEVFPFFDQEGRLGFSSNRLGTQGGLDLVTYRQNRLFFFDKPLNSPDDDFGLFFKNDDSLYLASNRDNDYFNDDIWLFIRQDSVEKIQLDDSKKVDFAQQPDSILLPNIAQEKLPPLPVKLFFWNDSPGPSNRIPNTTVSYDEAYAVLQDSLANVVQVNADLSLSDFKLQVRQGNSRFQQIIDFTRRALQKGNNVKVTLTGYASKRGVTAYNRALAGRRTRSIERALLAQLSSFSGESLDLLEIKREVRGESEKGLEPELSERLSSVYSVESGLQRFVEIRVQ
jgi:outer membrane protein OmpA-like peptidoglycan-associated protein